jgi:Flp pilus assembly protein TadG
VEFALVLPVLLTFVFGILEYGRLQLAANVLKNACRQGSRYGSTEGISTADASARVHEIVGAAMDPAAVDIIVKDASIFDTEGALPQTAGELEALPNIELGNAAPRQLFLIRATVAYADIAIIPMPGVDDIVLTGQAFMRHE